LPDVSHREQKTWELLALALDLQCASCGGVGVSLSMSVPVEQWVRSEPAADDADEVTFRMGLKVLPGEHPVDITCLSCGAMTKLGNRVQVATR
jgi:hypothetical protein